jgi:hypothetical protein
MNNYQCSASVGPYKRAVFEFGAAVTAKPGTLLTSLELI